MAPLGNAATRLKLLRSRLNCCLQPHSCNGKGSDNIAYIYSANGEKLAKRKKDNKYQYYAGSMVYNDDKLLDYLLFEEGMVYKTSTLYAYEYYLKDHLGNTRVAFRPNGTAAKLEQATEYYPFGMNYMPHSPAGSNKYLYNGKEKQDDVLSTTALDWYDYGARFYDPSLGRFTTKDPLSEDYYSLSPYGYCAGNPIACRDENGEWINFVVGAVVGAVVDAGLQAAEIALDDKKSVNDFSWKSVGVSAASGAVGAGIISKVGKAMKVAELTKAAIKVGAEVAMDATTSAANQLVTKGEVDLKDVAIDVAAGQLVGGPVGKIVKGNAQSSQMGKVLKRQADRAQRVASGEGTRPVRAAAAEKATEKASNYGTGRSTAAAVTSSNITSTLVEHLEYEDQK